MSTPITYEQRLAANKVFEAVNKKYAYDVDNGDEATRLDDPLAIEMLRAEVQSYVLTSMMEHDVLAGWSAAVTFEVKPGRLGSRVEMNVNFRTPQPPVDKVTAVGEVR